MHRADFSDLQNGGYKINQFRLIHSPGMRSKKFIITKKECQSSGNIIGERNLVVKYLIEQNEINFTIYYLSVRLMFLFITTTLLFLVSHNTVIALPIISVLVSLIFYFLAYRYKGNFALLQVAINFTESIYNVKINEIYKF
jgi:hypothetical protein